MEKTKIKPEIACFKGPAHLQVPDHIYRYQLLVTVEKKQGWPDIHLK